MPKLLILTALALPATVMAQAQPPLPTWVEDRFEDLRGKCASHDGGNLQVGSGAFTSVELDGDGERDGIFDEGTIRCSTDAPFLCGTGGCGVEFRVKDDQIDYLTAHTWKLIEPRAGDPCPVVRAITKGNDCGQQRMDTYTSEFVWADGNLELIASAPAKS